MAAKYHKCEFKKLNCQCDIPNENILREFKIKSESNKQIESLSIEILKQVIYKNY